MTLSYTETLTVPSAVAVLGILPRDARLTRYAPPASRRPDVPAPVPPLRAEGDITRFSPKARARLCLTIRNVEGLTTALVVSYGPEAPSDDRIAKRDLNRLLRWLTARGINLVWRQEWSRESGRVHWHLLLSEAPDRAELTTVWAGIIGTPNHRNLIHLSDVRDHDATNRYMVKPAASTANIAPSGYLNMGRYWGKRTGAGQPPLVPPVVEAFIGTPAQIAPIVRIARKMARNAAALIGRRPRRDGGTASLTLWDVGGRAAPALRRYYDALPSLRPDLWPDSASQRGALTPAPSARRAEA